MGTVNALIDRIRSQFRANRGEVGFLSASLTDSATNLQTLAECVFVNSVVELDTEQVFVTANPSDNNYTVVRGWNGTTAKAHSNNALFYVDPLISRQDVFNGIIDEINSWPDGLYHPISREITAVPEDGLVEVLFDSEVVKVLRVDRVHPMGYTVEAMYSGGPFKQDQNYMLRLNLWDAKGGGTDYVVVAGVRFDTSFITYDTDMTFLDIPINFTDIVIYGVAWRLRLGGEEARVSGIASATANVREGANVQAAGAYKSIRDQRIAEETFRLRELYGV